MSVERLGRYRILAKIGQGGMARVLLTIAEGAHGFSKLLVIKELREELAHDPDFLAMFLREARIAARLNHPNIVQTYEVGSEGGRYFIAMEYLEGQPLNAVYRKIGRSVMPLGVQIRILADVLTGLDHAHTLVDFDGSPLEIVHRDVSPQNVFVTYDGQVKLVDFGIAKTAGAASTTRQGTMKGKLSYIAPEQCRSENVDARADVFAVGLMLWEALAQRRIIKEVDQASLVARRLAGREPRIRDVAPDVAPELADICDRATAYNPADRYQTAREFRDVLEHWLANREERIGAREVAALLAHSFSDERMRIRTIVEEQVQSVDLRTEPIAIELHPSRLLQSHTSLPAVPALPLSPPSEPPTGNLTQLTQSMSQPPRARSRASAVAVALAVIGLAGVAALAVRTHLAAAHAEALAQAPSSAPTGADIGAPAWTLRVSYPTGARLKLDGGIVEGHPFTARVPRDGSIHKLEIEQDGFVTETRTVAFDRDVELSIELVPAAPTATADAHPRARRAGWRPQATPTAASKSDEDDVATSKRPPPSVSIDEDNPYRKK